MAELTAGDSVFTVYHSNNVDVLQSLLVELIRQKPLDNPFTPEHILVQSPGMSQWLNIELAKAFGVAANIVFPLPATFIWDMFIKVLPDVPKRSAFNKESMTWKLMHILPTKLALDEFEPLRQYLEGDDDNSKCYQLCEKIADIFDGYLVYRPDWIASWEAEKPVAELADEHPWQAILWRALYDHTLTLGQSPYHRANLYDDFLDTLNNYQGSLAHLPARLFVFGITALPPRYMQALHALGQHIDVHLMFTNPCQMDWSEVRDRKYLARLMAQHVNEQVDTVSDVSITDALALNDIGNSLLASMGKMGRDNMSLLTQLQAMDTETQDIQAFVDIDRDCLLHHIHADILALEEHQDDQNLTDSQHKPVITMPDKSLTFHACHSPMREVEVLHDQLLQMFSDNPALKPRDIIVMVADINAYSPAIQAVFGNAQQERYIPYSISDRAATQESPILNAYLHLLNLPSSRCLASELLELLETPAILAHFELTEDNFNHVKHWVEQSGIRWGLNASTGSEFNLPKSQQNTWQFGIQRMLLGYAMPPSAGRFNSQQGEIAPYNEVQGMDAVLVGKLAHFINSISRYREALSKTQSIDDWQTLLVDMIDDFFTVDLHGEGVMTSIRSTLSKLKEQLTDAAYQQDLPPSILCTYLQNTLSGARVSQRFLAGQVNFCTLMPMRSIPFDVVCLLGMNDGKYPRSVPKDGFDLINGRARPGDRSRRDDDRYMFLEAIMSAQQTVYISYVGQSIQDNSVRVPSVLVSELMEYCQQNYRLDGDASLTSDESGNNLLKALFTEHPMVPFSVKAFQGEQPSYAREWLPVANREGERREFFATPLPCYLDNAEYPLNIELAELQRFWRLPVAYFFNRRLHIQFDSADAVMEDDEPFSLNNLESYQLRDSLLDQLLLDKITTNHGTDAVVAEFVAQQKAQGRLPVGAFADITFEKDKQQTLAILDTLTTIAVDPEVDIQVNLQFTPLGKDKPIHLNGWLTQVYHTGLVRFRSGKIRPQDVLSSWIDHLAMNAMGLAKATHMVGFESKKGVQHIRFAALDSADSAKALLEELITLHIQGMSAPLSYFPSTSHAAIKSGFNSKTGNYTEDVEKAYKVMEKAFVGDDFFARGEGNNSYINRVWSRWGDTLADDIYGLAVRVIQTPLLQAEDQNTND